MDRRYTDVPPKLGTMGLILAFLAVGLAWYTAPQYGIASDVANYFRSSLLQMVWARDLLDALLLGRPASALESGKVYEAWRWFLPRIPHPPLSRELGGLTWLLGHNWLDTLTAYRLAVMLCYGALVGWVTVFTFWAARSRLAGLAAGLAAITYPALFAHGHLAHTDLFLATFWFAGAASMAVFVRTLGLGWLVASGMLLGAAAATKFSGLLLAPVLVIWLVARRPGHAMGVIFLALSAAVVFFLSNPLLWIAPSVGLQDYFTAGVGRAHDEMALLRTEYFGTIHVFRPPFHYPWVWSLIVLPPSFIVAIAGALGAVRKNWLVPFCLLNMGILYAALLLPSAPMHDGIRLLLPVLPFQCVLVGIGVVRIVDLIEDRFKVIQRPGLEALVLIAAIAPAGAATVRVHPYQLSYVNFFVGGVRGADEKGLEVTNLKEVFSPRVVADLGSFIPAEAIVDPGFMTEELCFYQAQGYAPPWVVETQLVQADGSPGLTLTCRRPGIGPAALGRPAREPDFVFVLNRAAVWRPVDRALFLYGGAPAYEVALDGVPLFRVYRTR